MAYLFIDDREPEASEYGSNFLYFDESDPAELSAIMRLCLEKAASNDREKGYELLPEVGIHKAA